MSKELMELPVLLLALGLGACGDHDNDGAGADTDTDTDGDTDSGTTIDESTLPVDISVDVPWSLSSGTLAEAVSLEDGVAVVTYEDGPGEAYCPDCEGMAIEECPEECRCTDIALIRLDASGVSAGAPVLVRRFHPGAPGDHVRYVNGVERSSGRLTLALTLCDGDIGCAGELIHVDGDTATTPVRLYDRRYGDILRLAANPLTDELLVVRTTANGLLWAGAWALILDGDDAVLREWGRVGSSRARYAQPLAHDEGFAIVAEDTYPGIDEPECGECESLIECLAVPAGCVDGMAVFEEAGIQCTLVDADSTAPPVRAAAGSVGSGGYSSYWVFDAAEDGSGAVAGGWWWGDTSIRIWTDGAGWSETVDTGLVESVRWIDFAGGATGSWWVAEVNRDSPVGGEAVPIQPRALQVGRITGDGAGWAKVVQFEGFAFEDGTALWLDPDGRFEAWIPVGMLGESGDGFQRWDLLRLREVP